MSCADKRPAIADEKNKCCGCGACLAACPVGAISLKPDSEGFLYPIVDSSRCTGCLACERVCDFRRSNRDKGSFERRVYAARLKDKTELEKSSSGGAFTALSEAMLRRGGAVVCSSYDLNEHREKYVLITSSEDRDKARGSVYVQSEPDGIHSKAVSYLKEDSSRELLFAGMGCQATGFLSLMKSKGLSDRVTVCDIICHGSPSPLIWREYARFREKKHGGSISRLTFKDKTNGWKKPTPYITINGKNIEIRDYVRLFYSGCALRPSCHECPYSCFERCSDITIGDFWGIDRTIPDFYDEKGNSVIIIQSEKGARLFEETNAMMEYRLSDMETCMQKNLQAPTPVSDKREQFWKDYERGGISLLIKRYGTEKTDVRLKNAVKRLIGKK